jgi:hypothetical protein
VGSERIIPSFIAGGHNHHDSGFPCRFHSLAKRIELVRLVDRTAERKVNYPNVVFGLQFNGAFDGSDDVAVVAHSLCVQYTQIHEPDSRSDSPESLRIRGACRVPSGAAEDTCHMCSVSVRIICALVSGNEALAVDYPVALENSADKGILNICLKFDTAVDDGDTNILANIPRVIREICANGWIGVLH